MAFRPNQPKTLTVSFLVCRLVSPDKDRAWQLITCIVPDCLNLYPAQLPVLSMIENIIVSRFHNEKEIERTIPIAKAQFGKICKIFVFLFFVFLVRENMPVSRLWIMFPLPNPSQS